MECDFCEEQLKEVKIGHIAVGDTAAHINNEEIVLFVCVSQDCKNRGIVIAMSHKPKKIISLKS